jgi:hypothetical protein
MATLLRPRMGVRLLLHSYIRYVSSSAIVRGGGGAGGGGGAEAAASTVRSRAALQVALWDQLVAQMKGLSSPASTTRRAARCAVSIDGSVMEVDCSEWTPQSALSSRPVGELSTDVDAPTACSLFLMYHMTVRS